MKMYKIIAIKVALIAAIALVLSTEIGKQYADQLKPLVETILQQQ